MRASGQLLSLKNNYLGKIVGVISKVHCDVIRTPPAEVEFELHHFFAVYRGSGVGTSRRRAGGQHGAAVRAVYGNGADFWLLLRQLRVEMKESEYVIIQVFNH